MPTFKLPLSGAVTQTIAPWTAFFSPFDNQYGGITINLGRSSAPEVEQQVLSEVGSYGKQLGRIEDALTVMLQHFHPSQPLSETEQSALDALKAMIGEVSDIKEHHRRHADER